jgi:mono/diheme cytochrome c family protein
LESWREGHAGGGKIMMKLAVALLMLPFAHAGAFAQAQGDAQAGKAYWEGNNSQCRNCHGENGQGAFGPDLAGRKLTLAQFTQAVRHPWGIMPAFIESQISDGEIANLAAYFGGLPSNDRPGKWRFEVPANAARGQAVLLSVGCGQCHGPILDGPRQNMGAVDMDFDWFKALVYNHTTALPAHAKRLDERAPPRIRMGNFNPMRVYESQLRQIYRWAKDEAGFRARVQARLSKGEQAGDGVTYKLQVENGALPGKGLVVEDATIRLVIPKDASVVSATGEGYKGVQADEQAKANVAVWQLSRLAPKDHQSYSVTLSKAGTAADNVRGDVRWSTPKVKTGPFDRAAIAPAPL